MTTTRAHGDTSRARLRLGTAMRGIDDERRAYRLPLARVPLVCRRKHFNNQ